MENLKRHEGTSIAKTIEYTYQTFGDVSEFDDHIEVEIMDGKTYSDVMNDMRSLCETSGKKVSGDFSGMKITIEPRV